jgi:ribose/xylose/arabinose/galactoside ABC-type transport system permease subunit
MIGVLENGIVLLNTNTYAAQIVTGAVVILPAVALVIWQKRRRQRA